MAIVDASVTVMGESTLNVAAEKLSCAQQLAALHASHDADIVRVFRINSSREEATDEPVKLLEVNQDTAALGIMPVMLGPTDDVPYPVVIVQVTPTEYALILENKLSLPKNWVIGDELFSHAA